MFTPCMLETISSVRDSAKGLAYTFCSHSAIYPICGTRSNKVNVLHRSYVRTYDRKITYIRTYVVHTVRTYVREKNGLI